VRISVPQIDLDATLGCGQAFRWEKSGDSWSGVAGGRLITLRHGDGALEVDGAPESFIRSYLRLDDDLDLIREEISRDAEVAKAMKSHPNLRLIRQDLWECSASYILATCANVPRIRGMVASVCRARGREIADGVHAFPTPEELAYGEGDLSRCRLGYRERYLVGYAESIADGRFDLGALRGMSYEGSIKKLKEVTGIGDKVADCIALFALDHLQACPVDVRIARAFRERYGVSGSYAKVSSFARERLGRFAGYAQEHLYLDEARQ